MIDIKKHIKNQTMITKRQLRKEIQELREEYERFKKLASKKINLLEYPPKYETGEVIGKYTIVEYKGVTHTFLGSYQNYDCIVKGKVKRVSSEDIKKEAKKAKS